MTTQTKKTIDIIQGGDMKRSKLKDKQEGFQIQRGIFLAFGLIVGANH
jgi:hypothetical protein